ncbi:MAG: hypothetical protein LAT67_13775 [Balneolales bacterium]|nr:hypothetical protein [Balneolales bacterium]
MLVKRIDTQTQTLEQSHGQKKVNKLKLPAQELFTNMIRLNRPDKAKPIRFNIEQTKGSVPIPLDEIILKEKIVNEKLPKFVYTNFDENANEEMWEYAASWNASNSPQTYKRYILHKLYIYFEDKERVLTKSNFVNHCEVFLEESMFDKPTNTTEVPGFITWRKFTFSTDYNRENKQIYLVISYNGQSWISNKSLLEYKNVGETGKFRYKHTIISQSEADEMEISSAELFPILNHSIRQVLGLKWNYNKKKNPPLEAKMNLEWLLKNCINSNSFAKSFPYLYGSPKKHVFSKVLKKDQYSVDPKYMIAEFGQGSYDIGLNTYTVKFLEKGFYKRIRGREIRVLLVLPKDAENEVKKIKEEIIDKQTSLQQVLFTLSETVIYYDTIATGEEEVRRQLYEFLINKPKPNLVLFGIPFRKHDVAPNNGAFYYNMKALYREFQIPSVFISTEFIKSPQLKYGISNISAKICARLEGIPWRSKYVSNENPSLMVGVNAFVNKQKGKRYEAAVTMFREDNPSVQELYRHESTAGLLGSSICAGIESWQKNHQKGGRIIIHVHPNIKKREGLTDMLCEIEKVSIATGLDLYVVLINSNPFRNRFAWNVNSAGFLPNPGTGMRLPDGSLLLFINHQKESIEVMRNAAYPIGKNGSKSVTERYPYPIKFKLWKVSKSSSQDENTDKNRVSIQEPTKRETEAVMANMMRMAVVNWGSVVPSTTPSTIKYPKRIARLKANTSAEITESAISPFFEGV